MNHRRNFLTILRIFLAITLLGGLLHWSNQSAFAASQIDIHGPVGSNRFGKTVNVLPNGNIVVTDPLYSGTATASGAVYLLDGASGALISMLTGTTADDQVGSGVVIVLSNGNYVISSPEWNNGATVDAGAVTWGSATSGVSGVVSPVNSLVGSTASDKVGCMDMWNESCSRNGVTPLSNGNYAVSSPAWDNGAITDAGAVTWGNGTGGTVGAVSPANSLVGSNYDDYVGCMIVYNESCSKNGVTPLSNGNYAVSTRSWDNGAVGDAGAVTWGSGTGGTTGVVSAANSLVGSRTNDQVGWKTIPLSNGNYVVISHVWDNAAIVDAGAVTWGNGTVGTTGVVSSSNSLVGSTASDQIGGGDAIPLSNGNYVVSTPYWNNGAVGDVGAVTWGNGTGGTVSAVSPANSLVGSTTGDGTLGDGVLTPLSNGNYVACSSRWDNGAVTDVGAVTWGSGTGGTTGVVSAANSLVGSTKFDYVGSYCVTPLSNGNYVVKSPYWQNGTIWEAGAVTWGSGTGGTVGTVSTANSLVGSRTDDHVGCLDFDGKCYDYGVIPLSNGNYVVSTPSWDNGAVGNAGAVTWGSGTGGTVGAVSPANSLVGSSAGDMVGCRSNNYETYSVFGLSNGNYVVTSTYWHNGAMWDAGAATWGNGTGGTVGAVSPANSLVGSSDLDYVGRGGVTPLSNGNYVVGSSGWSNGATLYAGAVTWGNGTSGISGAVSPTNSLVGIYSGQSVGSGGVTPLSNGSYVVKSPDWGGYRGAVTWGSGTGGTIGPITTANSVTGTTADGGSIMVFQYDALNDQLVVGRPMDNIVTLFTTPRQPGPFLKNSPSNGVTGISTSPTLKWGTSSDAVSYEYCYDMTNDNACSGWTSNGAATSISLSGLSPYTPYYWHVRAVNDIGTTYADGAATAFWSFTTGNAFQFMYLPLVNRQ
jgi:hypothetical protein